MTSDSPPLHPADRVDDPLSAEGVAELLRVLPDATAEERELTAQLVTVDLSSQNAWKWRGASDSLEGLLAAQGLSGRSVGGGGMATTGSLNQLSNRMKQAGVAGSDVTVVVLGQGELLRPWVAGLAGVVASPTTRLAHAVVVLRADGACRVVHLVLPGVGQDPVSDVLARMAPAVPVTRVHLDQGGHATAATPSTAPDATGGTTGPASSGAPLQQLTDQAPVAWFVTSGDPGAQYVNIEGNAYHFLRTTRAGRDGLDAGQWMLLYGLHGRRDHAGLVYAVARIHQVHRRGEDRFAVFDRYLPLPRPLSLDEIGGDPRAQAQIPITRVDVSLLVEVLRRAGVTSVDQLPVPAIMLSVPVVKAQAEQLRLDERILEQCVAALRSGKHLILKGAPGTGKSTLAIALAKAAESVGLSRGPATVTTGTSDWTSTDTVGGYRLDPSQGMDALVFQPGLMLEAVSDDRWLVIDELNRADIDKAIGQFFSVLSGQPAVLPYVDTDGHRLDIVPVGAATRAEASEATYTVSAQWRLIATMNERDRDLLFNLSEALLRRFAVVDVPPPSDRRDWQHLLETVARVPHRDLAARLARLTRIPGFPLGPAIVIDCASYLTQILALALQSGRDVDVDAAMTGAIDVLVRPQLSSLYGEERARIERALAAVATPPGPAARVDGDADLGEQTPDARGTGSGGTVGASGSDDDPDDPDDPDEDGTRQPDLFGQDG